MAVGGRHPACTTVSSCCVAKAIAAWLRGWLWGSAADTEYAKSLVSDAPLIDSVAGPENGLLEGLFNYGGVLVVRAVGRASAVQLRAHSHAPRMPAQV